MESKAYVRLKYGKSTVKYGKSTVLYGTLFLAPTVTPHRAEKPGEASTNNYTATHDFIEASRLLLTAATGMSFSSPDITEGETRLIAGIV